MKIKEILLLSLSMTSLIACTNSANNITNNEDRDAMQILEEKREYYEELDKKKEKEAKGYQVEMTAEEAETEKEKLANMTEDEKLMYKVDKAKEKIDNMLDIAKKARQEELDVEETKNQVEEALKNITEEK
ncbi:hypothetical protein LDK18_07670 [Fusobacterium nucleatum subsp. nucleatum ATCC 23726]|uniref:Lipoprotein n=1 Tax=Fusobacterium nucleatum subsp. nucleatum (strain ATCC 23726 / VPI 4351) TaxID=525283 RepID=D5REK6_FUSN2|nr:hypothetical protein [Fusobacterium nucleatum]EFG94739.1 hypothetical protein HMPREF0397_1641 [Fusobacterium nucleatum subsp. nucleatum ATCC 23726]ERT44167.1 hypothetical protein HMPREF1539_00037 [Fusobacterium nucleatum CTI-2]